jgi:hypothetical protein
VEQVLLLDSGKSKLGQPAFCGDALRKPGRKGESLAPINIQTDRYIVAVITCCLKGHTGLAGFGVENVITFLVPNEPAFGLTSNGVAEQCTKNEDGEKTCPELHRRGILSS